jgi:hypothetical protein
VPPCCRGSSRAPALAGLVRRTPRALRSARACSSRCPESTAAPTSRRLRRQTSTLRAASRVRRRRSPRDRGSATPLPRNAARSSSAPWVKCVQPSVVLTRPLYSPGGENVGSVSQRKPAYSRTAVGPPTRRARRVVRTASDCQLAAPQTSSDSGSSGSTLTVMLAPSVIPCSVTSCIDCETCTW